MDATFSNYRKRLLSATFALLVGINLSTCADGLLATEPDSSSTTSARGTLVFVTPSKPTAKTKSLARSSSTLHTKIHSAVTPSSQVNNPRPRPAQRDLAVAPQRQLRPNFLQARPDPIKPEPEKRVQLVQHQEKVVPPNPIAMLLVKAHVASLQAESEADFSQIVKLSTTAIRKGARKEELRFARQLASWALNRRGQLRIDDGQQELADADFQAALDKNPANWRALHNRGVSLAQQGSFAEAFDDFNRVTQLNPKYAKSYANRATLFVHANDLQSALEDYQLAVELDPNLSTAQLGAGRVLQAMGQRDEAIAFFDAAAQTDPGNAETLCSRADLLADMGQYGKALADYANAIEADPEFAHAYRNGSWLLATCPDPRFRDPENALVGARQTLEFNYGQRHVALDTLAAALASAGQFDEAISKLQNAIALAPVKSKPAYAQRLQLYRHRQPFRTEPGGDIAQATYEVSDR